jgi:hypothetical protein
MNRPVALLQLFVLITATTLLGQTGLAVEKQPFGA